jgi:PAS domain S-box-containing protein
LKTRLTRLRAFLALWQHLTQPLASLPNQEAHRKAVMLNSILLVLASFVVPAALIVTLLLTEPRSKTLLLTALLLSEIFLILNYFIIRRRPIRRMGEILSWFATAFFFVVAGIGGGRFGQGLFYFLIIPLMFVALFETTRLIILIMVVHLVGMLLIVALQPLLDLREVIVGPFSFYVVVSLMVMLVAYYRRWLEKQRAEEQAAERARSEQTLREQANQFNQLLSSTPDVIIMHDREGRYLYVNAAGLADRGVAAEEVIGKNWRELGFPEHIGKLFDERLAHVFNTGESVTYETAFLTPQGERHFETTLSPLRAPDGTITHIVNTIRDITRRKVMELAVRESEERYRIISELISDYAFACRVDKNGDCFVEWVTDSFPRVTGYDPNTVSSFDAYHPDDVPRAQADIRRVLDGEEVHSEYRMLHKNGNSEWIYMTRLPMRDETGRVTGFYAVAQNITERKRAEEERLRFSMEHDRLALVRQMVNAISHDFRNTLSNIETARYLIQRMISEPDRVRTQTRLEVIQHSVNHLSEQLDNLSTLTSLTDSTVQSCDLNLIVNMVMSDSRFTANQVHVTLTAAYDPSMPLITADPEEIRRAIKHLLVNAIAHTPAGGRVHVRTCVTDKEAWVEVHDSGGGIAPEHQNHIFDMFYRADEARSIASGGVGLGLSIVKMVATAHSGRVWVESALNKGSVFTLALPIHRPHER